MERSYEDAAEVEAVSLSAKGLQGGWWPQKPGDRRMDSPQHLLKELSSTPQAGGLFPGRSEKQPSLLRCGQQFCYTALGKHKAMRPGLLGSLGEGQEKEGSKSLGPVLQTLI